jgi:transcription elongation factor Elf1
MKTFNLRCNDCGSDKTDICSCVAKENRTVEITYICTSCGSSEEVMHYLYYDFPIDLNY